MLRRSERQNLKDIRQRWQEACEAIVCQNYKSIYCFMAYLTDDTDLAEELTQETFASAWANISRFKGRASLRTWLHRIAYHKFVDSRRKLKRDATLMARLKEQRHEIPGTESPFCRILADEHLRFLYKAIGRLEPSEYLVIVLHYIQDLSFREMAKVLDEPAGTIKWRTSHALKRLKALLTDRV